jgi:hypothetical protein
LDDPHVTQVIPEFIRSSPEFRFFDPLFGDIAHSMEKNLGERIRIQGNLLEVKGMAVVIDDRDLAEIEHIHAPLFLFWGVKAIVKPWIQVCQLGF